MKDFLKFLPQILGFLPSVMGNLKSLTILVVVVGICGGIGYGVYMFATNYKDPYKCFKGEIYKQISFDSGVYVFEGGYCIDSSTAQGKE